MLSDAANTFVLACNVVGVAVDNDDDELRQQSEVD